MRVTSVMLRLEDRHESSVGLQYQEPSRPYPCPDAGRASPASSAAKAGPAGLALAWTVDKGLFLDSVGNDNTHPIGEVIEITATFAESVTGTPRITFTLGTARKHANFLHRGLGHDLRELGWG